MTGQGLSDTMAEARWRSDPALIQHPSRDPSLPDGDPGAASDPNTDLIDQAGQQLDPAQAHELAEDDHGLPDDLAALSVQYPQLQHHVFPTVNTTEVRPAPDLQPESPRGLVTAWCLHSPCPSVQ